jgi:hypothetical protein
VQTQNGNESVGPDGTYLFSPFSQLTASAGWNMECSGGGRRWRGPEQSAGEMKGTRQMGRLGQLRPARIAKTRGAGAGEVILHPSRARGRRGKLCWSATSAKNMGIHQGENWRVAVRYNGKKLFVPRHCAGGGGGDSPLWQSSSSTACTLLFFN